MSIEEMFDYIYITKVRAKGMGFTHEGKAFGVPAWIFVDGDIVHAATKAPILNLWCKLADNAYDLATYFMHEDQYLETPVYPVKEL